MTCRNLNPYAKIREVSNIQKLYSTQHTVRVTKRLVSVNICSVRGNSAGIFVSTPPPPPPPHPVYYCSCFMLQKPKLSSLLPQAAGFIADGLPYLALYYFSGYNVPSRICPSFLLKIAGWFDGTVKMMVPSLDRELKLDNSKVYTVNSLVSDHLWWTNKWSLTRGGRLCRKSQENKPLRLNHWTNHIKFSYRLNS